MSKEVYKLKVYKFKVKNFKVYDCEQGKIE